jgi:protein-disulfide isomerase
VSAPETTPLIEGGRLVRLARDDATGRLRTKVRSIFAVAAGVKPGAITGMARRRPNNRLDRPVDRAYDHALGPANAPITLVEYGSYDCPHCRAANEPIAALRDEFGDRLRYVFRHRPIPSSDLARRAA